MHADRWRAPGRVRVNDEIPALDGDALQELADRLDLDLAADLVPVTNRLQAALERYAELELRSDGRRVDLVTLTRSTSVVEEFLAVLDDRGLDDEVRRRLSALGRFGAGAPIGLKLTVAGPLDPGELYVRNRMPIPEVRSHMDRRRAGDGGIETVESVGNALDSDSVHMLAADADGQYTCLFTTWLTADGPDPLEAVLDCLELPSVAREQAQDLHSLLSVNRPTTVYVSVPVPASGPPGRLKLDYPDVRLGLAAEVAERVDSDREARTLVRCGEILDVTKTNYVGVVVGPDGAEGTRAYFTRHSSRSRL